MKMKVKMGKGWREERENKDKNKKIFIKNKKLLIFFIIKGILVNLKHRLKMLQKSKYSNLMGRLKSSKERLDEKQQKLHS